VSFLKSDLAVMLTLIMSQLEVFKLRRSYRQPNLSVNDCVLKELQREILVNEIVC